MIDNQCMQVFVPGADTATDESSRNEYEHRFGDTSFSFWYGGVKFIISQSPAVIRDPERAIEQEGLKVSCISRVFVF